MNESLPSLADAYALVASGRLAEAIDIFERRAEQGDGEALFTLGDVYWRGIGAAQDLKRGRDLFQRSSEAGFDVGHRAYTNLLANGIAGEREWKQALARLEEEARGDRLRAYMLELIWAMDLDDEGNPLSVPQAEVMAERPQISLYRHAFTPGECNFLRLIAEPSYERTAIVINPGDPIPAFFRTAEGSVINWLIEDPVSHAINCRLAALSETDVRQGEPMQILRYEEGQEYKPHFDWLDIENRRLMTALIYLNDDYQGGETAFTKIGIKMKGELGDALVFRSDTPEGTFEPLSEHAGLPVTSGTKYLASRWIRERPFAP